MTESVSGFPPLQSTRSWAEQDQRIADAMRAVAKRCNGPMRILEAGCGNSWSIRLPGLSYQITGVDLNADALNIRRNIVKDLDEAIHGDLCTVTLPSDSFDVVYSAYVLEHIRNADLALANMIGALKAGGLLILRIPDPDTAKGLITRTTPFWFHIVYYRWVMKKPLAGTSGHGPYPTYHHPVISRTGIRVFTQQRGLSCQAIYADTYARDEKRIGIADALFRAGARTLDALSLGRFTSRYNDLVYIFEKR